MAFPCAAPCEAGTAGPAAHRVVPGSQPTQCNTLGLARGSGPFEPPTGESSPPALPSPPAAPFSLSHDRALDGARSDRDEGVWSIQAPRTKGNREHRVPLCRRAMEILKEARALSRGSPLVFPSVKGKPFATTTLSELLRELNIAAVPHGFRSSFRDWAAEETDHPREVAEPALAHKVRSRIEAAYRRSDLFERRRRLMDDWAGYLAGGCRGPDRSVDRP